MKVPAQPGEGLSRFTQTLGHRSCTLGFRVGLRFHGGFEASLSSPCQFTLRCSRRTDGVTGLPGSWAWGGAGWGRPGGCGQ